MFSLGSKQDILNKVAIDLAGNFLEPLYQLSNERNYYTWVGTIAEIVDWAVEFCVYYYGNHPDWKYLATYEKHQGGLHLLNECILAWGQARFAKFCAENAGNSSYLLQNGVSG